MSMSKTDKKTVRTLLDDATAQVDHYIIDLAQEVIYWHEKGVLPKKSMLSHIASSLGDDFGDQGQRLSIIEGLVKMKSLKIVAQGNGRFKY